MIVNSPFLHLSIHLTLMVLIKCLCAIIPGVVSLVGTTLSASSSFPALRYVYLLPASIFSCFFLFLSLSTNYPSLSISSLQLFHDASRCF